METLVLEGKKRMAEKPRSLRLAGRVPAVYYGQDQKKAESMHVDARVFQKLFAKAGENTIIELDVEGTKVPVLVHEVQYNPVTDEVTHIDFLRVDMKREVTTTVKVIFVGVAPAVKNMAGILDIQKHELKIKCLPKDLIHSVDVDITSIIDFHTSIHVKEVKMPSTIKVLDNPEDTVVTVTPPRAEEETKPAATAEAAAGAAPVAGAAAPGAPAAATAAAPAGKEAKK